MFTCHSHPGHARLPGIHNTLLGKVHLNQILLHIYMLFQLLFEDALHLHSKWKLYCVMGHTCDHLRLIFLLSGTQIWQRGRGDGGGGGSSNTEVVVECRGGADCVTRRRWHRHVVWSVV
jgi:hypothetical protein